MWITPGFRLLKECDLCHQHAWHGLMMLSSNGRFRFVMREFSVAVDQCMCGKDNNLRMNFHVTINLPVPGTISPLCCFSHMGYEYVFYLRQFLMEFPTFLLALCYFSLIVFCRVVSTYGWLLRLQPLPFSSTGKQANGFPVQLQTDFESVLLYSGTGHCPSRMYSLLALTGFQLCPPVTRQARFSLASFWSSCQRGEGPTAWSAHMFSFYSPKSSLHLRRS